MIRLKNVLQFPSRKAFRSPFLGLALASISLWSAHADDARYRLGVQDRLRIHVYEWPALTGEFTVGPDGSVSLPLIGQVTASGADIAELGKSISDRLKQKASLSELPDVAVDVVQYRPFYVLGRVERSGEYPYRPGMVVLHAVSIAGGVYRRPEVTDWGSERDAIASASEAEVNLLKVRELTARMARLQAEADGVTEMPAATVGKAPEAEAFETERRIFDARRQQFDTSLKLLADRIVLFRDEIKALEGGAAAEARERAVILRELQDTKDLVARALAPAPRVIPLERGLAQIEREMKENEAMTLRARQQINIADQLIADLKDVRRAGAFNELKATQGLIDEARERYRMSKNIVRESESLSLEDRPNANQESLATLSFTITRTINGETKSSEAFETTPVLPGDVVNVIRRISDDQPQMSERRRGRTVAEAGASGGSAMP